MTTIDLRQVEDTFVVHFGGDFNRINAYTLATTLVGLADAARAANAALNPGYEIEIVVEALSAGSFRTKVRALYRGAGNLFSRENLKAIVLSIVATFIYEKTLGTSDRVVVNVNTTEVVIEEGDNRIIVPREVYEATREVESLPEFRRGVSRAAQAAEEDTSIRSLGFSTDEVSAAPEIAREQFAKLSEPFPEDGLIGVRDIEEIATVRIVRAILERSRRRWEFVWNGVRIPAPVLDSTFYDSFFGHRITIAPGDALKVRMHIRQRLNADLGVYLNESYEIIEVLDHIPRAAQDSLDFGLDAS